MPVNHFTLVYLHINRISGPDSKNNIENSYPEHTYRNALVICGLTTLFDRRKQLCNDLFSQRVWNGFRVIHELTRKQSMNWENSRNTVVIHELYIQCDA